MHARVLRHTHEQELHLVGQDLAIALDDAIELITGLLCAISGSIKSEQRQE
jgi:hypothetical protein